MCDNHDRGKQREFEAALSAAGTTLLEVLEDLNATDAQKQAARDRHAAEVAAAYARLEAH